MKSPLVGSLLQISCVTIGKSTALFFLLVSLLISEPAFSQGSSEEFRTIHVKFKPKFKPSVAIASQSARSGMTELDKVSEKYRALSIQRIFPESGKYEAAHRAYGLHLWYKIEFRKDARLDEAIAEYRNLNYFSNVEECKEYTAGWKTEGNSSSPVVPPATNDPLLSNQWHFHNTGQTGGTPGADINLLKAWETETGKPNVIVAIIDGGININHPDLAGALWTNTGEVPANGIDDDGNGYVDDVHGYGFGDKSSTLYPHNHATHVAGTIGAISNNGIGVSGIAGGSGSGDGIRLMSCAAFGNFKNGGFEAAMVYAADNGAVISQNSWGGGSTAIEAAIDYFVNRAGYDNSDANFLAGIQTGPMAGGLVIFAAGNSNSTNPNVGYPASYVSAIAVASTDHNDKKSYFSNYGNWVDIAAPGSNVFSAYGSDYDTLSGTSMACPHVSGVAALVVSHIQRPGLYPNEVWNRLRLSARSIAAQNPTMSGLLGTGRIDAFASLREPDAIPPAAILNLHSKEVHYSSITLEWTATGENGNVGQAAEYEIRYSTIPITASNFGSAVLLPNPPIPPVSGDQVNFEIKNLSSTTTYYFALKSRDIFRNLSGISNIIAVTTLQPGAPEVITTTLSAQLFSGGISSKDILVKNTGGDEVMIRLGTPAIAPAPVGLPTGAKGRLFSINSPNKTIEELNLKTGAVIRSIPVPEPLSANVEGLAFDGVNLYYGSTDRIYKLHARTGQILRSFILTDVSGITGLAWSGRYLYVSDRNTGRIHEVDSDNGTILRRIDHFASALTCSGTRESVFFISNNSSLVEVSTITRQVIKEIYIGGNPAGLGYSEVENVIFVSDGASIKAIDPDTGVLLYTLSATRSSALASDEYKPGWLEAGEEIITIPSGATSSVPITFIATGLPTGEWTGTIQVIPVNTNIAPVTIPVKLQVTGATDIETAMEINFGTQFLGYSIDTVISVENNGTKDLIVHNIQSNDGRVQASLAFVTLAPGEKVPVTVTVTPSGVGLIDTFLSFSSNDPDEGVLSIPVRTDVFQSPAIEVNPASLNTTLSTGESKTLNFTARNTGGSVLHWNVNFAGSGAPGFSQSTVEQGPVSETSGVAHQSGLGEFTLHSPSPEQVTCLSYDHQSGFLYARSLIGSTFYRYDPVADSWTAMGVAPGTFTGQAAYLDGRIYHPGGQLNVYTIETNSWTSVPFPLQEVTGNLTSDGQYIYVAIGASLYRYDPVSNGWLALAPVPRNLGPNGGLSYHSGVIYAHEDGTSAFTGDGNTRFYKYYLASNTWITTSSIPGKASSGSAIDPSGRRYFVVGAPYARPGVGVQMSILDLSEGTWLKIETPFNVTSHSGLVYVGRPGYSGVYFIQVGGTAFGRYETNPTAEWISITPSKGDLAPGATQSFTVDVNATGLNAGTYSGNLRVSSSQPAIERVVPLTVTVAGVPDISMNLTTGDVGDIILGKERGVRVTIKNNGTALLSVSSITSNHPDFHIETSAFTLQTGESIDLVPIFQPTTTGPKTAMFTFHNNDPDENAIQFILKGNGVNPPVPEISTDALSAHLLSGSKFVQQVTISNTGGGIMEYIVEFNPAVDWIKGTYFGFLTPGQTKTIDITFDASGKPAGNYTGVMRYYVHTIELETEIPVTMTVTDAADILTSKGDLNFGYQFINYQYDSIITIKNNGVLPLSINTIESSNASFSISTTSPLNLAPGESVSATIRFHPTTIGTQSGQITLISDDPDEGTLVISLAGSGIGPPLATSNPTEMIVSAQTNEVVTQTLALHNPGGSVLKWQIIKIDGGRTAGPLSAGEFTSKSSLPEKLIAPTVNPATGQIYAQAPYRREIYTYNFATNSWTDVGDTPAIDFVRGGSVFLGSRMYSVYPENPSTIFVYNLTLADWTTIPNGLGAGTGTITTDGTLLYLAGGGNFKSLNPKTGIWTDLPLPTITLDGVGGLNYYNGDIYAHEGNGNGFAKYTIATGVWETLVPLPDKAVLGSAFDPINKRYYAYGTNSGGYSYVYEYDLVSNLWNVLIFTLFDISDGGMIYTPESDGIYFIQGKTGTGFAQYEPKAELSWMRAAPLDGEIAASGSQNIDVNFNAHNLNTGVYHGVIEVASNDPSQSLMAIPVTFNVTNPGPAIEVPSEITATVERITFYKTKLKIENKGPGLLQWSLASFNLPQGLTLSDAYGEIAGFSSNEIDVTYYADTFPSDVFEYTLELSTNDLFHPIVSTRLKFNIVTNHAPIVSYQIPAQWLTSKADFSMVGIFSDPDNDPIVISASSSDTTVARVTLTGSVLTVYPVGYGVTFISLEAIDIYNFSTRTEFQVSVSLVTALEEVEKQRDLLAIPNPFVTNVKVRYHVDKPGRATISIVDIEGKVVWQATGFEEVYGQNEIEIDGDQLRPGVYNCRVLHNGDVFKTTRLVKY